MFTGIVRSKNLVKKGVQINITPMDIPKEGVIAFYIKVSLYRPKEFEGQKYVVQDRAGSIFLFCKYFS